ncbi:hypothetical protein Drose_16260 [Dactylosporangium roseum]|uniref:Uncharacterized protein n=1 Tax=Dactylosporangium roseum TaxID=47989 RepID=A0ABY5ZD87_9ACTN|nr:hypothetical protein [Dactylosporangium roseum]UWZ39634.1 hypothetical protein Drose_16260 [Dactylosporangium roseum]
MVVPVSPRRTTFGAGFGEQDRQMVPDLVFGGGQAQQHGKHVPGFTDRRRLPRQRHRHHQPHP